MRQFDVAVIGAQTLVGQEFIKLLDERNFPANSVRLFASDHYAGKKLFVKHQEVTVQELSPQSFHDVDIAFFSSGPEVSRYFAPLAVRHGALVIDTSSFFRSYKDIRWSCRNQHGRRETASGNYLHPELLYDSIIDSFISFAQTEPDQTVIVDTYQSVSGKDSAAIEELNSQYSKSSTDRPRSSGFFPPDCFQPAAGSGCFPGQRETREERKILEETKNIAFPGDGGFRDLRLDAGIYRPQSGSTCRIHTSHAAGRSPADSLRSPGGQADG